MKTFERVLFIIALLTLTSQSLHIAYKLWIKSSTSILDKYDDNLKSEIEKAKSLEELVKKYEIAYAEVVEYKKNNPDEEESSFGFSNKEPFKTEFRLKEAIKDWEKKSEEVRKMYFFWFSGIIILFIGFYLYKKSYLWLGLSLMIIGFTEIIYWTTPSMIFPSVEFNRFLMNKLILEYISIVLLIFVGWKVNLIKKNPDN